MIHYIYLGRMDYAEALRLQEELVALRTEGRIGNVLLLLEHPPVLTLGRNASRANILASDELLAARGVTLHEINRGGDVTYHGPGQLIGYPIFDLRSLRNPNGGRLGPVDFVRLMEEALIRPLRRVWRGGRAHLRPDRRLVRAFVGGSRRKPDVRTAADSFQRAAAAGRRERLPRSASTSPAASLRMVLPST